MTFMQDGALCHSWLDVSSFYSRVRSRQLCRENTGIVPVAQDNGLSDESSDEDEKDMDDVQFGLPETGDIDLGSGRGGRSRGKELPSLDPAAVLEDAVEDATRSPSSSPRGSPTHSRSGSVDSHASLASTVAKSKKKDKKDNKLSDDEEELMVAFWRRMKCCGTRRPRTIEDLI
ncbi:hypothetical protein GWK47_004095 [Chionoecetes opilio]|uniref:Uncharacterized protein n=1 Tax=Chionoecetes opilio TaxID=41210 RepID=A0A8J4YQ50_CHIOP|nr:hypothetical protein GWK47_004095 [Chionoecetes opilio]